MRWKLVEVCLLSFLWGHAFVNFQHFCKPAYLKLGFCILHVIVLTDVYTFLKLALLNKWKETYTLKQIEISLPGWLGWVEKSLEGAGCLEACTSETSNLKFIQSCSLTARIYSFIKHLYWLAPKVHQIQFLCMEGFVFTFLYPSLS